jgi:mono/diheme cytochrome c family protein
MNRPVRWTLTAVGTLAVATVAAVAFGAWNADRKRERQIVLPPRPAFTLPEATPVVLDRGRYLFNTRGCAECHGDDGGGRTFIDDTEHGMRVKAPNIAGGPNSMVVRYTAVDFERTIRHGVKPDGRPVFIMPSEDYARLTDADLGALALYVKQLPAAPGGPLEATVPLPVRVMYGLGVINDAVDVIDHALPPPAPVAEAATAEHGRYVASMCMGCHGAGLSGGKIPGSPPSWPDAANLTPGNGSAMTRYPDVATFIAMLRTGHRPDGTAVSSVMPFASLKALSDVDASAVYAFLKTLPARPAGER